MKGSAKAAGRSKDETTAPPEAPISEDDRRIRALILAELDRRGARPVARRTLALIAEGFVEPADGVPGYRIVDRTGTVRLRGEAGAGVPLTLHDLVDELREQHAPLFLPPAPEPEPEPARDTIADVRAAGARIDHSEAGLYLWVTRDEDCWTTIDWLAGLGLIAAPGTFYGPAGSRHVRMALTASDERVAAAVQRLAG